MQRKTPLIPMEDFFRNPEKSSFSISPNGNHMHMNDWIVVTVKNTNDDFSEIEPLNPSNKNDTIEGKFIKFLK